MMCWHGWLLASVPCLLVRSQLEGAEAATSAYTHWELVGQRPPLLPPTCPAAAASQQPQCVAWVEHPLYFLNDKYDSLNLWHALEDVTHAFEAYALKGWGSEAQVGVARDRARAP